MGDNRCQWDFYDERNGWQQCKSGAEHVHHVLPEGELLARGEDSERAVGMGLCSRHHVKNVGEEEWNYTSSMHPDTGQAYRQYGEWKRQNQHMQAITGRRDKNIPRPSPFVEMSQEHHKSRERGERYVLGDEAVDQHYLEKMTELATRYLAQHPEEKKPRMKHHPKFDPSLRKHWSDDI